MPSYEYKCMDCGKESVLNLTLSEHDLGKITCPEEHPHGAVDLGDLGKN